MSRQALIAKKREKKFKIQIFIKVFFWNEMKHKEKFNQ